MTRSGPRLPGEDPRDGRNRPRPPRQGRQSFVARRLGGAEPESHDLAELQATDALLDRVGRRGLTDEDIADTLNALLGELVRDVDLETDASRRFRAVLAGRTAQDGQWRLAGQPAEALAAGSARAGAHRRVPGRAHGRLARLARQLPLAGAAAAVVLVMGGSVLAAMNGNPLAPIEGLAGASDDRAQPVGYQQVSSAISQANAAVAHGDLNAAADLLAQARRGLGTVPQPQQQAVLTTRIVQLEQKIATVAPAGPTAAVPGNGRPTVGPGAVPPPPAGRTPAGTPTGLPTDSPTGTTTPTGTPTGTTTPTVTAPPTDTATPTDTGTPTAPPPTAASLIPGTGSS